MKYLNWMLFFILFINCAVQNINVTNLTIILVMLYVVFLQYSYFKEGDKG